jgi:hypothetical protein
MLKSGSLSKPILFFFKRIGERRDIVKRSWGGFFRGGLLTVNQ